MIQYIITRAIPQIKGMFVGAVLVFCLLASLVAVNSPAYGFEFVVGVVVDTIFSNKIVLVLLIVLWAIISWRAYDIFEAELRHEGD